jgi:hypothetical protein
MKHALLEYQVALFLAIASPVYVVLYWRRLAFPDRAFRLSGACSVVLLTALNAINLFRAGFLWHDEPNILSIAAAYLHGQPMYHDPGAGDMVSLLYGPSTFLVYLPFLDLSSRPMLAIRLAGLAVNLANVTMLYLVLRRRISRPAALGMLPIAVAYLLSVPNHIFGVRGDQFLLLALAAALLCSVRLPPIPAALAMGTLAGFALNFKITVAPMVCLLLYLLWRRRGWRCAAVAAALTAAAGAGPFLFHGISLKNYIAWVALSRHQGFERQVLFANLLAAAFLLLPGAILRLGARRRFGADASASFDRFSGILLLVSIVSCILTGAKNGAGPWHLLPLLPFIMLWTADAAACSGLDSPQIASSTLHARQTAGAMAIAAALVTLRASYRDLGILHPAGESLQRTFEAAAPIEIAAWINRFPGRNIAMGYGTQADDPRSSQRFRLALAGEGYFLDENALVESLKDRLPFSLELKQRILGCHDIWLIPHTEKPFATLQGGGIPNDTTPFLFPDDIRNGFSSTHVLLASGDSYDAWGCIQPTALPND